MEGLLSVNKPWFSSPALSFTSVQAPQRCYYIYSSIFNNFFFSVLIVFHRWKRLRKACGSGGARPSALWRGIIMLRLISDVVLHAGTTGSLLRIWWYQGTLPRGICSLWSYFAGLMRDSCVLWMKLGAREQNKSMTTLLFQHNLQHSHVCEMDETWSSFPFSFPFFNMVPRQNVSAATVQGKKKKKS